MIQAIIELLERAQTLAKTHPTSIKLQAAIREARTWIDAGGHGRYVSDDNELFIHLRDVIDSPV